MYCRACKAGMLKVIKSQPTKSGAVKRTRVCSSCHGAVVTYERAEDDARNEYEHRLVAKYRQMPAATRAAMWAFLRSTGENT